MRAASSRAGYRASYWGARTSVTPRRQTAAAATIATNVAPGRPRRHVSQTAAPPASSTTAAATCHAGSAGTSVSTMRPGMRRRGRMRTPSAWTAATPARRAATPARSATGTPSQRERRPSAIACAHIQPTSSAAAG